MSRYRDYTGYDDNAAFPSDVSGVRDQGLRESSARIDAWLRERGLSVQGETTGQRMARMAQFRAAIGHTQKPDPKQWARDLVARHKAGKPVLHEHLRLARAALGLIDEPRLDAQPEGPQRPDGRDRQAADLDWPVCSVPDRFRASMDEEGF